MLTLNGMAAARTISAAAMATTSSSAAPGWNGSTAGTARTRSSSASLQLDLANVETSRPCVGLGIGWSRNDTYDGGLSSIRQPVPVPPSYPEITNDELAAKLMGGIACSLTDRLSVDAGDRLLHLGEIEAGNWISGADFEIPAEPRFSAMVGHAVRVGLRYDVPQGGRICWSRRDWPVPHARLTLSR